MIRRSLQQICEMIRAVQMSTQDTNKLIHGVSIDSRSIVAGNLFIPIKGPRFNGHDFVREAMARGAAASLWNITEPNPPDDASLIFVDDTLAAMQRLAHSYRTQLNVHVIGITGSNGKTSTKDIMAGLLAIQYKTQKTRGNLNNHLGVPLTLLGLEEDTEMAVVEMGMSDLGEIEQLSRIAQPDAAVITSVSEVHLGDLKTRERIIQAKMEIVRGLKNNGLFVFHGDNPALIRYMNHHPEMQNLLPGFQSISFGDAKTNNIYPTSCSMDETGVSFTIADPECPKLFLPMIGKHQAMNALGAIAIARHFGLSYDQIGQGLIQVEASGMRNQLVFAGKYTIIHDAYKSNPTSLRAALDTLYELKRYPRKYAVLGDMVELGEEATELHNEIGHELDPHQIDVLFTIGPLAQYIARAAQQHFPSDRVIICMEKAELIKALLSAAQDESVILIKGSRQLQLEEVVESLCNEVNRHDS